MQNVNPDLKFYATEAVRDTLAKAQKAFRQAFVFPTIGFKIRGRRAGCAYSHLNHIELNAQLFAENVDGFIRRTIPHEVAHLITRALFPMAKRSHGKEWQGVMHKLSVQDVARC